VHETTEDIATMQALIDRSYAAAGPHLLDIHTPERRMTAAAVCERLTGMCLLVLATAGSSGRPLTGPVDGILYRGSLHFGSGANSVRFRHIRTRPHVSATHLPSEQLAVTVHGRAVPIDLGDSEHAGFRRTLVDIYAPKYSDEWATDFLDAGPVYARIEADRMFAFHAPELG
jgi:hypothetical protein